MAKRRARKNHVASAVYNYKQVTDASVHERFNNFKREYIN